ncbi:hypothetical protein E1218_12420 [Kribbella turkmenica]|uniref:Uncharacterized protein n=1 Tax=Kribbella turkmenica TaxID=2530375 RepID=A0A4R4X8I0_9ACTN|nr:hypothetical protein [Kribbella turkmenica]TDD26764.1 hypothetical protein E1218_12420 [Kribbella turkmenica]
MTFARHCELIVEQAELPGGHLERRPGCRRAVLPGDVGQLARHLGWAHRQATVIATTDRHPMTSSTGPRVLVPALGRPHGRGGGRRPPAQVHGDAAFLDQRATTGVRLELVLSGRRQPVMK